MQSQELIRKFLNIIRYQRYTIKGYCAANGSSSTTLFEWKHGKRVPSIETFEHELNKLGYELVITAKKKEKEIGQII